MTLRRGSLSLCCCTNARPYSTPTACSSPNRYSALRGLSEPPRGCWEGGQITITKGYHFFICSTIFSSLSGEKSSLNFSPNVRPWKCLDKMKEACPGVHVVIDFSFISTLKHGSLEDLILEHQQLEEGRVMHVKGRFSCQILHE